MPPADYTMITQAIRACSLISRGAFHPVADDMVPPLDGRAARTVVLVGITGQALWPAFAVSPEKADRAPDPLDRWTRRVVGDLARGLGAGAYYPFGGRPQHPFQRWARRAEGLHSSPLGLLIDPDYGLWHAYRAALAFADEIALPERTEAPPSPCEACRAQPCRTACPVSAIGHGSYDVARCVSHITTPAGAECLQRGCVARRACPVGTSHAYEPAQQAFHMAAFAEAHARPPGEA